jgi:hypothetical protein
MKNILSNFVRSKAFVLALGLTFVLPAMAHAEGFKGKFTLASETHWGTAVLSPGNYDFSLDSANAPTRVVVRAASGKVAAILVTMWSSETNRVKTNSLELESHGGKTFVSALYLNVVDAELHFAVPRTKEDALAHEAMKTRSTPMTASAQ